MNLCIDINDIIFTIGTSVFLLAGIRQAKRIYKTKSTTGVSLTHYHLKVLASSCMIIGFTRQLLPISIVTSIVDLTVTLISIRLITYYRKISFLHW